MNHTLTKFYVGLVLNFCTIFCDNSQYCMFWLFFYVLNKLNIWCLSPVSVTSSTENRKMFVGIIDRLIFKKYVYRIKVKPYFYAKKYNDLN